MADPYQFDSDGNLILDFENVKDAADFDRQVAAASAWKAAQRNKEIGVPPPGTLSKFGPLGPKSPPPDLPRPQRPPTSAWQGVPAQPLANTATQFFDRMKKP